MCILPDTPTQVHLQKADNYTLQDQEIKECKLVFFVQKVGFLQHVIKIYSSEHLRDILVDHTCVEGRVM